MACEKSSIVFINSSVQSATKRPAFYVNASYRSFTPQHSDAATRKMTTCIQCLLPWTFVFFPRQ